MEQARKRNKLSLSQDKYTRLFILKEYPQDKGERKKVWCLCDCGRLISVINKSLITGNTKSCGCYAIEQLKKGVTKHGKYLSPEHLAWKGIIQRCTNPKSKSYKNYGGRGIGVYKEWRENFINFYNYIGPKPYSAATVERIDNNKGYEPGNCRWATRKEQGNNTRKNIPLITFNEKTKSLADWSKEYGIKYPTLHERIYRRSWPIEKALVMPLRINQYK